MTSLNISWPRLSILGLMSGFLIACSSPPPSVTVTSRDISGQQILVRNVAVFDSASLQVRPNMDVMITGETITSIAPAGQAHTGADTYIIPGEGATLVPGLYDMHGHLTTTTGPSWEFSSATPEANLLAYAYAGVTTIFDPSDTSGEDAYARREKVASGKLIGPRIYTTGAIITHPDGHPRSLVQALAPWWIRWYITPKVATGVESEAAAIVAVNQRADAGADAIKVVVDSIPLDAPELSQTITAAIARQAKLRGIRTVAHIGTTEDAILAAEAGVALWVHGVYKERIPDEMIAQLVGYGIPMVTTSEVFDRYGRAADGPIKPTKLERETVSNKVLQSFFPIPGDFDPGPLTSWVELMQATRAIRLDNVSRLHAAGMTVLAGSDVQSGVFPGASLHRELANLVAAGLSPAEAIRAATLYPARYLADGKTPDAGSIEVGKRADLILVEGDPTVDINALANLREVILRGVPLDRVAVVDGIEDRPLLPKLDAEIELY